MNNYYSNFFWVKVVSTAGICIQYVRKMAPTGKEPEAGGGIRSARTTNVFRVVNFELFAKPVGGHPSNNLTAWI